MSELQREARVPWVTGVGVEVGRGRAADLEWDRIEIVAGGDGGGEGREDVIGAAEGAEREGSDLAAEGSVV